MVEINLHPLKELGMHKCCIYACPAPNADILIFFSSRIEFITEFSFLEKRIQGLIVRKNWIKVGNRNLFLKVFLIFISKFFMIKLI